MKKLLSASLLTLSLSFGSSLMPTQNAQAGIVIGAATATIIGPLIGLTICSGAFFWGIQMDGIPYKPLMLFVLDEHLDGSKMNEALSSTYPELDSYLVNELADIIMEKAQNLDANEKGYKEVVLSKEDLSPVIDILSLERPDLAHMITRDFSTRSLPLN